MPDPFYADDAVTIWHGDARALPLDDASVDLIVTSPPYFSLRSYKDGGEHYAGQLGSEASPAEFVDALIAATAEMVRVLKPSGSIWVNLGDKYDSSSKPGPTSSPLISASGLDRRRESGAHGARRPVFGRPKSLMGIPWRYALRCIDDLGLILRAEVIWSKPNGLPESVTDRVRRSHETWFHFTVRPRYFSAVDEVREATSIGARPVMTWAERKAAGNITHAPDNGHSTGVGMAPNPLGKLPGSVWDIPTQPLRVPDHLGIDHFAAFPMEWPRRIIRGWSPAGVCVECGEGRRPVSRSEQHLTQKTYNGRQATMVGREDCRSGPPRVTVREIVGEECACPEPTAPTRPAVVLDPFGGTGTTGLVARALGRRAHLVDLSADYCRLARWRVTDPGERARALEVPKPPPPPAGVDALFELTPPDPTERSA